MNSIRLAKSPALTIPRCFAFRSMRVLGPDGQREPVGSAGQWLGLKIDPVKWARLKNEQVRLGHAKLIRG